MIIQEHGKTVCQKNNEITTYMIGTYKAIEKAAQGKYQSWLLDTMIAVDKALKTATSRKEFIATMSGMGYTVDWQDNRKYIVFTNADGKKVRNSTLSKTFKVPLTKEDILYGMEEHTRESGKTPSGDRQLESRTPRGYQHTASRAGKRQTQRTVGELWQELDRVSNMGTDEYAGVPKRSAEQVDTTANQQRTATKQHGRKTPNVHRDTGQSR